MGADVVKVEPPGGDYTRGMSGEFDAANRNKRSLVLDLKVPAAVNVAQRLATQSDVVVETFRPGVADRLGIGPLKLRRLRSELVYCSLSSFGQRGSRNADAGHDLGFLALAGALGAPAHWSDQAPARSPLAVADIVAGLYGAVAIQAALLRRAATGRGAEIDLAISSAALAATSFRPTLFKDGGARLHLSPVNDIFTAGDGRLLSVVVIGEKSWARLRDALATFEPRLRDERFANEPARRKAGDDLQTLLRVLFARRSRTAWLRLLRQAGVAADPVLRGREPLTQPWLRRSGLLEPRAGADRVRFPAAFDGAFQPVRRLPPRLGQHSREVLKEIGLKRAEVEELLASGAVGAEPPGRI
jgi:crotonobetainyl-CoA:carnitine CoA-transferase CaiB-like acyl-CoA transferase